MSRTRNITIGARSSVLARVQAFAVGDALHAAVPGINIRYSFCQARGDLRPSETNVDVLTKQGGFTADLGEQLDDCAIDLAVHSWKDLPLSERTHTEVVAAPPRADARDILLLRRVVDPRRIDRPLRILSSSARRRINLQTFLTWALPWQVPLEFSPVRGDIETRLRKLLRGDGDALVIAKAALDRLLGATAIGYPASAECVRQALAVCHLMVIPLSAGPAAPGQGALALEIRRDRRDLRELLAEVSDRDTVELVRRERQRLAALGEDDHPVGITIQRFDYGDVEFMRGEHHGVPIEQASLHRRGSALPPPARASDVWCGDQAEANPFERVASTELPLRISANTGLLVARADALPQSTQLAADTVLWSAGLATWRRLAARGLWVSGSDDSLGETAAVAMRHLLPQTSRWLKLSHDDGFDTPLAERFATYRLSRVRPTLNVHNHSHFFWQSGSQFREYLREYPALARAWHGCGPGNTLRIIRDAIGTANVRAFLSAQQFRTELST